MASSDFYGSCVGGRRNGEPMEATTDRVPVLAPGTHTEGQLLGFYMHTGDCWKWQPERLPDDNDRLR